MKNLLYYLNKIGYADLCCSFNPLFVEADIWFHIVNHLNNKTLKKFCSLLLLNYPVHNLCFNNAEKQLFIPFIKEGVITYNPPFYQTKKLSLYISMGHWFFFETPDLNPAIYYGDDSFALLNRLNAIKKRHTLDLCSGPGIQAITSSFFSEHVTSVEINPISSGVAKVNKKLNNIQNWEILTGDLYIPLPESESYDYIIANPPLLPFPEKDFYPFVGHGGNDGWAITWKILQGLPNYLSDGGMAKITGTTFSNKRKPVVIDRLMKWCITNKMDCIFTIISKAPLNIESGIIKSLIFSASANGGNDNKNTLASFNKLVKEQKATHLISHILTLSHGKGKLQLIDLSYGNRINNFWFV